MITNLTEYETLCRKTLSLKYDEKVRTKEDVSLHSAIGLVTEIAELKFYSSVENLKEELGDYCWYLVILTAENDHLFVLPEIQTNIEENNVCVISRAFEARIDELTRLSCKILDKYKKLLYYGKNIDKNILKADIYDCWLLIQDICWLFNIDLREVFQLNIDKLKKRYGDKFTEEAAINRDIDNEMSHFKN